MLRRLLSRLRRPEPTRPLPEADARHLLGALMVRVAQADGTFQLEELRIMDRLFAERFGLDPVAAARLRADCERLAAALPPTPELGPMLEAAIPADQRAGLCAALQAVAAADGSVSPAETAVITAVGSLLQGGPALGC